MSAAIVQAVQGGIVVEVLASAGSSASKVRGIHVAALKVAVRAAPEKGKANAEIEEVLAEFFGVPTRNVTVVSGPTSRQKRVQVLGLDLRAAQQKIAAL